MTYHMRDCKNLKPAGETLAQALLALALAMSATALALALAIGAAMVCT